MNLYSPLVTMLNQHYAIVAAVAAVAFDYFPRCACLDQPTLHVSHAATFMSPPRCQRHGSVAGPDQLHCNNCRLRRIAAVKLLMLHTLSYLCPIRPLLQSFRIYSSWVAKRQRSISGVLQCVILPRSFIIGHSCPLSWHLSWSQLYLCCRRPLSREHQCNCVTVSYVKFLMKSR